MECATSPVEFSQVLLIEHQKNCKQIVTVETRQEGACCSTIVRREDYTDIQLDDNSKEISNDLNLVVKWKDFPPNPPPLIFFPNKMHDIPRDRDKISHFHVGMENNNVMVTMTMDKKTYTGILYQVHT